MVMQKVVIPAKAGTQNFCNTLKKLDSGLCRNDGLRGFRTY